MGRENFQFGRLWGGAHFLKWLGRKIFWEKRKILGFAWRGELTLDDTMGGSQYPKKKREVLTCLMWPNFSSFGKFGTKLYYYLAIFSFFPMVFLVNCVDNCVNIFDDLSETQIETIQSIGLELRKGKNNQYFCRVFFSRRCSKYSNSNISSSRWMSKIQLFWDDRFMICQQTQPLLYPQQKRKSNDLKNANNKNTLEKNACSFTKKKSKERPQSYSFTLSTQRK